MYKDVQRVTVHEYIYHMHNHNSNDGAPMSLTHDGTVNYSPMALSSVNSSCL